MFTWISSKSTKFVFMEMVPDDLRVGKVALTFEDGSILKSKVIGHDLQAKLWSLFCEVHMEWQDAKWTVSKGPYPYHTRGETGLHNGITFTFADGDVTFESRFETMLHYFLYRGKDLFELFDIEESTAA
jgi:hypothetical protein